MVPLLCFVTYKFKTLFLHLNALVIILQGTDKITFFIVWQINLKNERVENTQILIFSTQKNLNHRILKMANKLTKCLVNMFIINILFLDVEK